MERMMRSSIHTAAVLSLLAASTFALPGADLPQPYPAPERGARLTPPIAKSPSINGARIVGATPGKPFLFRIPVSGERPLKIEAKGLPKGLALDSSTGIISGKLENAGSFDVEVSAANKHGKDSRTLVIEGKGRLSLTPPMGWNSWYSYSEAVSQEGMLKIARLMDSSGMADHGWTYINIDDCWQGARTGPNRTLQANDRFPDMKAMCDEIHGLGLKAGIYSTPWMGTYAGFIGGSSPNEEGDYSAFALPADKRKQEHQLFGSWPGSAKVGAQKTGGIWMFDRDAKQWGEWGFDYAKIDWLPNDVPQTERIRKDLDASSRDIVLSLSNAAPMQNMPGLSPLAQCIRTTGDIHDAWGSISGIGFSQEPWQKFVSPGHWCDPDMLQVGMIGTPNQANTTFRPTRLTPDEQYTQVSLWCLLSAPLLISSDLSQIDDFTQGLLMNDDLIAVNQDKMGAPARRAVNRDGIQVWSKPLSDGSLAVGFFNTNGDVREAAATMEELGLNPSLRYKVRDLWKRADVGEVSGRVRVMVNPHGATVFKLMP
ncbi:aldolase-type tim barrel [Akkermansia glycaniphila]|uniref:Alpha-galactosidase n=2 Tax=Akkermansia glycaniphila TaxID=1679444 RepID=A0A1H6MGF2_9BACT|nr:aldolase-type tim barrel [Akkermansia glycaniphila]